MTLAKRKTRNTVPLELNKINVINEKETRMSVKAPKPNKPRLNARKIPPDPDELNDSCAARAREALTPFRDFGYSDRGTLLRDLMHDIMHLCDRDASLGDFEEEVGLARYYYEDATRKT